MNTSVQATRIVKVGAHQGTTTDLLAVEEPLEIRLAYGSAQNRKQISVSVTMRTPGYDFELALGFLFTEGIIQQFEQIEKIRYCQSEQSQHNNVLKVELSTQVNIDVRKLQRNFYTTSSCGICGKASIEAVDTLCSNLSLRNDFIIKESAIHQAPQQLKEAQVVFKHTGGLHAAGLFDAAGNLLLWREDIGRHNALDKLIGACFAKDRELLRSSFLLLSGRVSFELVQKALMAEIPCIAAVGAPSHLAVHLAQSYRMTLIGFVREQRFNIYSGASRLAVNQNLTDQEYYGR